MATGAYLCLYRDITSRFSLSQGTFLNKGMRTKERKRNTLSFQKYTLHLLSVTISLQLKDGKEAIQKRVDLSISLSEEKCITFRFHRDVITSATN